MVSSQNNTGRSMSVPMGLALGGGFSLLITILSAAVLAWMVDREKLAWENIGYGIMITLLLAAVLGARLAYGRIKRQRLLICTLSGVVYLGLMLSITALFFGGQYDGALVTAALILGGSAAAGMIPSGGSRKTTRKRR